MSEHEITINRYDGASKYGRPKRTFQAVCACGWEDRWEPVQRWVAVEHGEKHVRDGES